MVDYTHVRLSMAARDKLRAAKVGREQYEDTILRLLSTADGVAQLMEDSRERAARVRDPRQGVRGPRRKREDTSDSEKHEVED